MGSERRQPSTADEVVPCLRPTSNPPWWQRHPHYVPFAFAGVAPEVLMGGRNCTNAIDMYSYGEWNGCCTQRGIKKGCMQTV